MNRIGMDRMNVYLLKHCSELEPFEPGEKEEARKYLENRLKKEVRGDESREGIERVAEEILTSFFFED